MNLVAGTLIEPARGGFDLYVGAQGIRFCIEVLNKNRKAIFPVLQDVFKAPSSTGLQPKRDVSDGEGGVIAGFVFHGDFREDVGLQSSLEQLSYGINARPKNVDVAQVHLLAFRANKQVSFSDFPGGDVQSFKVFDFHVWLTVVLCGENSTTVVFYETCYRDVSKPLRGAWWSLRSHSRAVAFLVG